MAPGNHLTESSRLNRQQWLIPSSGEMQVGPVAEVALLVPAHQPYTYAVPSELAADVLPGALVEGPYGKSGRLIEGYCLRVSERPWDQTLRPLYKARAPAMPASPAIVELGEWISRYYVCPIGLVFKSLLGVGGRVTSGPRELFVRRCEVREEAKVTPRQAAVLAALSSQERPLREVLHATGATRAVLRALVTKGLLEIIARPKAVRAGTSSEPRTAEEDAYELTAAQSAALKQIIEQIKQAAFQPTLLFGVPGSGKTEVYVRAIRHAVAHERQAILLVPEIALATQLIDRLARRFPRVATLHSQMSDGARAEAHRLIAAGEVDVVIGTRNAIFAPCCRLGLIIVDEEQEGSYKNLASPFFHARDVAIKRAQLEKVPVILGSATPSLETWQNAISNRFNLVELPTRVPGAELPRVHLSTPEPFEPWPADRIIGPDLGNALRQTLERQEQAILLHNRRGYSVGLHCAQCGVTLRCPQCHAALVYHRTQELLRCHHCSYRRTGAPRQCENPECAGPLRERGFAIQRLEDELRELFPQARLLRLDSDTMRRRQDYAAALSAFTAREADILIGTQMIAKGLDFPMVRLVGMIDADAAMYIPDFRAGEYAFQLIMQVIGRAGRREGESLAIVQTRGQPAIAISDALRMDYRAFASRELRLRERYAYPPAVRLARLVFADARAGQAAKAASDCYDRLIELAATLRPVRLNETSPVWRIDPAEPCPAPRLREFNRFQVLVRANREVGAQPLLHAAIAQRLLPSVQRLTIDVDPMDMV